MAPKVALMQLNVPADAIPTIQFKKAESFLRKAVLEDADLVVLPEMALGIPPRDRNAHEQFSAACAIELQNFQSLAKLLSVNIIPGILSEASKTTDGETIFYNTSYYISRTGSIKLRYRKVNLWGDERLAFTQGNTHQIIDTPEFGPVGIQICWDLAFPEAFRPLIQLGAKTIVIPTLWRTRDCGPKGLAQNPDSERTLINPTIYARAFEQNVCVVFCNAGGDKEAHFCCSQITMPFKGAVVILGCGEQIVVVEVDLGTILEDAEEVWGIRTDINSEGWYSAIRTKDPISKDLRDRV